MQRSAPFLIIGHHRSGTNFLGELIQRNPAVACANEPFSMHTEFFRDNDLRPWSAADYDQAVLHPELYAHPKIVLFLQELRKWLVSSPEGCRRGFKETLLYEKLPWLGAYLPGLRVIHLVRDPRAVAASVLNVPEADELWKYSVTVTRYLEEQLGHSPGAGLDPFELCLRSIGIRWELARQSLAAFEHITVRLEDLVGHPEDALGRLMNFLDLEPTSDQLEFIADSQRSSRGGRYSSYRSRDAVLNSWRSRLTDAQQDRLTAGLRPFFEEYGYAC
ncbi:sulfotransferase family protein [Streptomyces sp. NPDC057011]|uniref:sulfotransferase family protein n=1 Tax=unclassified Streptomyces TaxID=2593676 RepID=UPI0036286FAD